MKMYLVHAVLPAVVAVLTIACASALPLTEAENNALNSKPQQGLTASPSIPEQLPEEPEKDSSESEKPVTVQPPLSVPKGRNMIYHDPLNTDVVVLAPMPENGDSISDYSEPILTYRPADSLNYDYSPDMVPMPYDSVIVPEPADNLRTAHVIVYPSEDPEAGASDMATAESNIVFRPLFSYRRQTAQRRRVYSRPPTSSFSSSNRNEQRGPQGYPYRYPSYGYPNYYPSYYQNAQFDHVA